MKLYIYGHCPYCVRVQFALTVKKIACQIEYLLNDDVKTPVSMIGAKQVPILEKENGIFLAESLDIIKYLDNLQKPRCFAPFSKRVDLAQWLEETRMLFRQLLMPRWVQFSEPEFATSSAREYFTKNKEVYVGSFSDNLDKSEQLIKKMNQALQKLDELFVGNLSFNENLSLDDVDLYSRLRGLTGVKGLILPKRIKNYIDFYSQEGGIKLYYQEQI